MYTIKTLNAISPVGLAKLPANQFEIDNEAAAPQGILVRSADMHDAPLPDSLLAIARAGAGTNNIPVEDCTNKGIVVFNTPGANANAVAELVVGALVAGSRNLVDAVNWAQTLKGRDTIAKDVEKGKRPSSVPSCAARRWASSGWGPSVRAWPTPLSRWAWRFWAMTRIFPSMLRGACPAVCSTVSRWAICCPAATT